jgi:hypothetical protein
MLPTLRRLGFELIKEIPSHSQKLQKLKLYTQYLLTDVARSRPQVDECQAKQFEMKKGLESCQRNHLGIQEEVILGMQHQQ